MGVLSLVKCGRSVLHPQQELLAELNMYHGAGDGVIDNFAGALI